MDRDECLHAEARPFAVPLAVPSILAVVVVDGLLVFGGKGESESGSSTRRVEGRTTVCASELMPPTLGRPPCRLCQILIFHWPIRNGGPSRRSMPTPGGHQHGLHRGRPSRARFLHL